MRIAHRRAAVLPFLAVCLPVVVLLCVIAINIAYITMSRADLKISSDAAARAASRTYAMTGDVNLANAAARDAASRNLVAGQPLQLADSDIVYGRTSRDANGRYLFSPSTYKPHAVQVIARRNSGSMSGSIASFFPSSTTRSSFEAVQVSTAAQIELDVLLVLDRSGSMVFNATEVAYSVFPPASAPTFAYGDPAPPNSRWENLRSGVAEFINVLYASPTVERLGVVTYNHDAVTNASLRTDYAYVQATLAPYSLSFVDGATGIGDGIDAGRAAITGAGGRSWATKVLVVMTDGIQNNGVDPMEAAPTLRRRQHPGLHVDLFQRRRPNADAGHRRLDRRRALFRRRPRRLKRSVPIHRRRLADAADPVTTRPADRRNSDEREKRT